MTPAPRVHWLTIHSETLLIPHPQGVWELFQAFFVLYIADCVYVTTKIYQLNKKSLITIFKSSSSYMIYAPSAESTNGVKLARCHQQFLLLSLTRGQDGCVALRISRICEGASVSITQSSNH